MGFSALPRIRREDLWKMPLSIYACLLAVIKQTDAMIFTFATLRNALG